MSDERPQKYRKKPVVETGSLATLGALQAQDAQVIQFPRSTVAETPDGAA